MPKLKPAPNRVFSLEEFIASARTRLYANRIIAPSGCWEWTGYANPKTHYGQIQFHSRPNTVHRVSWIVHFGTIPDKLCVLHSCDNRLCFNPTHLFLGTHKRNSDDKIIKGRMRHGHRCGEANPGAKLTWEKAEEIKLRCNAGESTFKIAAELGVNQALVWRVWRGKSWRYVTEIVVMTNQVSIT